MTTKAQQSPFTGLTKAMLSADKIKTLGAPIFILLILVMMTLPLPAFALDVLFTFNIAISILVLIASLYTTKPLDFASFPTVLLVTTLLRLSLNVASTRIVLLNGHEGPDAAGKVIEAFGQFIVGGNLAVGIVVFAILVAINFIVITKGAGRIAEVSARFTLDAMPGKQMAIDADMNSGLITEEEAKARRQQISQEAEFYGSMDGASKFVRGDAVAGILILAINIIGGLTIGMSQHDLSFSDAGSVYVLLSIGDGLVGQIPALVISIAAGLVVARVGQGQDIGTQMAGQLFASPQAVGISAGIIFLLGMIPGMPNFVFLLLAGLLGFLAYRISKKPLPKVDIMGKPIVTPEMKEKAKDQAKADERELDATWDDLKLVDTLSIEVGYRLVALADKDQGGQLIEKIRFVRKKFAQEVGFLPPKIHLRDSTSIKPSNYRIMLKGVCIGESDLSVGQHLAIDPGGVTRKLSGPQVEEPTFGLPAVWVPESQKENAAAAGYTVVDSTNVLITHLQHLIQTHAAQILGRKETEQLLEHYKKVDKKTVEDLCPKLLDLSTVQRVFQNLLEEKVHIRDIASILECLLEHGSKIKDPDELTALVRVTLGHSIVDVVTNGAKELHVMVFESKLEEIVAQALHGIKGKQAPGIDPNLAETIIEKTAEAVRKQEAANLPPILLVQDSIRLQASRLLRRGCGNIRVLSHSEIPEDKAIRVTQQIGSK